MADFASNVKKFQSISNPPGSTIYDYSADFALPNGIGINIPKSFNLAPDSSLTVL